jgi:DNA helicase HerA-like ATPase
LVFSVRTEDFNILPKFKAASKLALGISEKEDLPFYIYAPEQIAVELALKPEERTYYDFPQRQWNLGERLIVLGQSLDGEVVIDLASEDTPQLLVVGTTGSGKSNFFRAAGYCLLMQGARVDVCGGKVSDYEDFADRFPSITMNDMGK